MNKRILLIGYRRVFAYYAKCKHRLERSLAKGTFSKLAGKKRQSLINRITRLQAKTDGLQRQLGLLTAGTLIALTTTTVNDAFGQSIILQDVEDLVNTYTTGNQSLPDIAIDSKGDFVVTWKSEGQDGDGFDGNIYAQRYSADGQLQGAEFKVNTYTTGNQSSPAIAMDRDGDFVISWQGTGLGGDYTGIYTKRYNAQGIGQEDEFRVNTYTISSQVSPAIAMDSDGDFVISWMSLYQDEDLFGIYAQRYNAVGEEQGKEFKVNTYTTSSQRYPAIAMDSDGDFVISWRSEGQGGDGISNTNIYAQRYNAVGEEQGKEFKVNTYTTGNQFDHTVAMDRDGDFVVSWVSYGQDGTYEANIYAQRYKATGKVEGTEFKVNTYTTNRQGLPAIAMNSGGIFVITWQNRGQDGDGYGIYYRLCKVPVDINLQPAAINENGSVGATVGSLTTVDLTENDTFNYKLVMGEGAEDNAAFEIVNDSLKTKASFNFEFKKVYKIRIQTTDETDFTYEKAFIINIIDINDTPSNINLSASSIDENNQVGILIGTFTTIDQDPKDTHTYTLVSGDGDSGNSKFTISANQLKTNAVLDFEKMNSLSVRIQTDDRKGGTYIKVFSITIKDINDYPTLDSIPNPAAINEDSGAQTVNLSGIGTGGEVAQTVVVTAVSDNPSLITAPQVIYANPNATGSLTYTPLLNAYGTARITVTISDGQSKNNIITRSFTVTINPVNDAPTLDRILDRAPIPINSGKQSIELKGIRSGAPNEIEKLDVTAVSNTPSVIPHPTIVYTSPNSTGMLEFTPLNGQFGENIEITVTVTDQEGAQVSEKFLVTILLPPPVAPIGLRASVSEQDPQGTILMSWNDVDYESGYRIYVSVNSETNFGEPVKSNGPNETTFTHTGLKADSSYYYKVVAYNNSGAAHSEVVGAHMAPSLVTAISDIARDEQIRLYPNPTTGKFYVKIPAHSSLARRGCSLIFYNALGEVLWKDKIEKGQEVKMVYIAQLPSGIYMLAIENGDTVVTRRVIKK